MVQKAQENYPNLELSDAIQEEANAAPGREALQGEGGASILHQIRDIAHDTVQSINETVKEMKPATRNMKEKHC